MNPGGEAGILIFSDVVVGFKRPSTFFKYSEFVSWPETCRTELEACLMKDSAASFFSPSSSDLSSPVESPSSAESSSIPSFELLDADFELACLAVARGTAAQMELAAEFLSVIF